MLDQDRQKLIEANRLLIKQKACRMKYMQNIKLTPGAEKDIAEAITSLPDDKKYDIHAIVAKVVDINYEKHVGADGKDKSFEYQMHRKCFDTTGDIQDRIMIYFNKLQAKAQAN